MTNGHCSMKGIVYLVICGHCDRGEVTRSYIGETGRPAHERFMEHIRAAKNPSSYKENAVGKHFMFFHKNEKNPELEFSVVEKQSVAVKRKISEAMEIRRNKPEINDKDELSDVLKFIVH